MSVKLSAKSVRNACKPATTTSTVGAHRLVVHPAASTRPSSLFLAGRTNMNEQPPVSAGEPRARQATSAAVVRAPCVIFDQPSRPQYVARGVWVGHRPSRPVPLGDPLPA